MLVGYQLPPCWLCILFYSSVAVWNQINTSWTEEDNNVKGKPLETLGYRWMAMSSYWKYHTSLCCWDPGCVITKVSNTPSHPAYVCVCVWVNLCVCSLCLGKFGYYFTFSSPLGFLVPFTQLRSFLLLFCEPFISLIIGFTTRDFSTSLVLSKPDKHVPIVFISSSWLTLWRSS